MKQDLIDLHLQAMLFRLTHLQGDVWRGGEIETLVVRPTMTDAGIVSRAKLRIRLHGNRDFDLRDAVHADEIRQHLLNELAKRDNLNAEYADVIALTAEDIKRLKGGGA